MAGGTKSSVFKSGEGQAVRIPAEYRFKTEEVYIRRDPHSGDLILSEAPPPDSWEQVFAALDQAGIPDDFMADRKTNEPKRSPFTLARQTGR